MPMIEGLGDEVTLVLATFLVCVVVTLAWFSTHTADLPALREVGITVIERTQIRRRVVAQPGGNQNRPPDNQSVASLIEFVSRSSEEVEEGRSARSSQETGQSPLEWESVTNSGPSLAPPDTSLAAQQITEAASATNLPQHTENILSSEKHIPEAKSSDEPFGDRKEVNGSNKTGEVRSEKPSESVNSSPSSDLPVEDEVRRRRIQFFQNSPCPTEVHSNNASSVSSNDQKESSQPETTESNLGASNNQCLKDCKPAEAGNADGLSATSSQPQQSSPASQSTDAGSDTQGAANSSSNIRVKLKYMNETQRLVYTSPLDTIGNFRRTHFQQELQEGDKWVRFIYNGQDLRDDEATLQAYQVGDNCTMHCLITNKRRTPSSQAGSAGSAGGLHGGDDEDGDSVMGALMYPLFTLVLAVVWYFRLTYRQYFSPMSTVCLIGISFLLGLGYFSSLRTTTAATTTGNQQQPSTTAAGNQTETRQNHRTTASGHAHSD
ncbi:transmembrane and ubiquitin-like domain-containing protein 1 [Elysia marginata]|uniref:Transmembrane and ubiquitin-like domain-containing protein 1 n=1 Tax=Elysia marginata TaxID=1093978 RepID=A0AAV4IX88_9GAST|nr:transmembrane and ubiquitin-like domain-containing protein 1 [Elysia marginata]